MNTDASHQMKQNFGIQQVDMGEITTAQTLRTFQASAFDRVNRQLLGYVWFTLVAEDVCHRLQNGGVKT